MAHERVTSTGLTRQAGLMYYIKGGDVWSVPMKKPGGKSPKGKAKRVVELGLKPDYSKYLYYLDGKLNVMRARRKGK